jgi:hypothetical protein
MLKNFNFFLLLITFSSALAQSPENVPLKENDFTNIDLKKIDLIENQASEKSSEIKELCREFLIDVAQVELLGVFIFTIATIAHEFGHVIAGETLFDVSDPKIHIGEKSAEKIPELFSFWNIHFHKAMPWKKGHVEWKKFRIKKGRKSHKEIDDAILSAAGGLMGATFMYLLLTIITGYCAYHDNFENKESFKIILKSFFNAFNPFSYILDTKTLSFEQKRLLLNATLIIYLSLISHVFYGFTPYRGGDGLSIWKKNFGITGTPLKVAHILSTLGAWGCWVFLIKKYCAARKKFSPEISQFSIPVVLFSLLLMYNQLIPKPT